MPELMQGEKVRTLTHNDTNARTQARTPRTTPTVERRQGRTSGSAVFLDITNINANITNARHTGSSRWLCQTNMALPHRADISLQRNNTGPLGLRLPAVRLNIWQTRRHARDTAALLWQWWWAGAAATKHIDCVVCPATRLRSPTSRAPQPLPNTRYVTAEYGRSPGNYAARGFALVVPTSAAGLQIARETVAKSGLPCHSMWYNAALDCRPRAPAAQRCLSSVYELDSNNHKSTCNNSMLKVANSQDTIEIYRNPQKR